MVPSDFYAACALCGIGLILLLKSTAAEPLGKSAGRRPIAMGVVFAGVAWLMSTTIRGAEFEFSNLALAACGFLAALGCAQVLTNPRPIFAALFFILVIMGGAVMYILLDATFIAFALIIVYAGAILITYMFVLMLAQQAPAGEEEAYDRFPREPVAAVVVGVILLAVLGSAIFGAPDSVRSQAVHAALASSREWSSLNDMPRLLESEVQAVLPGAIPLSNDGAPALRLVQGQPIVRVSVPGETDPREISLPSTALPSNTRTVGLALVEEFPVSLELAGVILMMALFGAVILARRQTEHAEDERRDIARGAVNNHGTRGSTSP